MESDESTIRLFVATKAFVVHEGKVLILQESTQYADGSNAGRFDVPGGRVQPGERFDEGLRREIQEETGLNVDIVQPFFVNEWRPVVRGEQWQIVGIFFVCRAENESVQLSKDHQHFEWINPRDYKNYQLIENLHPAFDAFAKLEP